MSWKIKLFLCKIIRLYMEYINLNNVTDNIEEFILVKRDIENLQLEENKIENRATLTDFVINMNLENTIFMYKGSVIPFKIVKGKNSKYMFYTVSNMETADNDLKVLSNYLEKIKYDLSRLEKKSIVELMDGVLNSSPVFVIDNDYYV